MSIVTASVRNKIGAGILAAALAASLSGCWNLPVAGLLARNDLSAKPDEEGATGKKSELLHFANMSDIHIVDDTNPLRIENIRLMGNGLYDLGALDALIQPISRDQDRYSARIWDAVIRSVNETDGDAPLAFAMITGDHTDTGLKKELEWFIGITDGVVPASLGDAIFAGNAEEVNPVGINVPWYVAVGNHDVEYQGTFNNEAVMDQLLQPFGDTDDLIHLRSLVDLYKTSVSKPWWHGLDNQPAVMLADSYGYYGFDAGEIIHVIVLNTAIYNFEGSYPKETLAGGCLDATQYEWMVGEIEANRDRLCIVISHHSPTDGFSDSQSDITADELMKTLCRYDNVIAHINGHSHVNKVEPVQYDGLPGGYWNINTCSILEWPQEWRDITVEDNGDGTGTLSCRMVRHGDKECLDVASGDADARKKKREGDRKDRNTALKFHIPPAVKNRIVAN
jgi:hypothetical protein